MRITITIDDQLSALLRSLGKDMPRILNLIVASIAKRHKEQVRQNYLSGQALQMRTGELRDAIFYYKIKRGIWEVRPIGKFFNWSGIFETGGQAGPGRKVYIPPHPFQTPALRDITGGVADRIMGEIISREVTRKLKHA